MSDEENTMRIKVKRSSKKKAGYQVELREDGHYYVTATPSKKSSIKPGDRLIEVNGVKEEDFKSAEKVNELFDMLVMDAVPVDEEESSEEESSEEEEMDSD